MKIYCRFCGQGVDYELKAPSICGYCSKSYSQASSPITTASPTPTQPKAAWQFTTQNNNSNNRRNASISFDFNNQEEEQFDENVDLDLNNLGEAPKIEFARAERVSGSQIVGTAPRGSSKPNIEPRPSQDNAPDVPKKAGRPKKVSKQDILKEFQTEAGTYKQNQKNK